MTARALSRILMTLLALAAAAAGHEGEDHSGEKAAVEFQFREVRGASARYRIAFGFIPSDPVAGEEVQFEFKISELLEEPDPLLGSELPVSGGRISVEMAKSPDGGREQLEVHSEGEAGLYGVHRSFARPGEYILSINVEKDKERFSTDFRFRIAAGPLQTIRLAMAGLLMLLAGFAGWAAISRRLRAAGPGRMPGLVAIIPSIVALITVGAAAMLLADNFVAPRIAVLLLPERPEARIDWAAARPPEVELEAPRPEEAAENGAPRMIAAAGVIRPRPESIAEVTAPIWGRIEFAGRKLSPGDYVKKGEELVSLVLELSIEERYPMNARYQDIKSELDQSRRRMERAEQEYRRAIELLKLEQESPLRQKEAEWAERVYRAAVEEYNLVSRQERAYQETMRRRDPKFTPVTAPISGTITEIHFTPGELNPTEEFRKLFTIVDLSRVWLEAEIFEKDIGTVMAARRAYFSTSANPERRLLGRPVAFSGWMSEHNRTLKVIYEVPNPGRELKLGMFANVWIELD